MARSWENYTTRCFDCTKYGSKSLKHCFIVMFRQWNSKDPVKETNGEMSMTFHTFMNEWMNEWMNSVSSHIFQRTNNVNIRHVHIKRYLLNPSGWGWWKKPTPKTAKMQNFICFLMHSFTQILNRSIWIKTEVDRHNITIHQMNVCDDTSRTSDKVFLLLVDRQPERKYYIS